VNRNAGNLAGGQVFRNYSFDQLDTDVVITPMVFFGCAYYPWSALNNFPILQKIVLINPLVYGSEGLRATLVPQFPHLSIGVGLIALLLFNVLLLVLGLRSSRKKR
jgi:ABC-2 type transport system permease protein